MSAAWTPAAQAAHLVPSYDRIKALAKAALVAAQVVQLQVVNIPRRKRLSCVDDVRAAAPVHSRRALAVEPLRSSARQEDAASQTVGRQTQELTLCRRAPKRYSTEPTVVLPVLCVWAGVRGCCAQADWLAPL